MTRSASMRVDRLVLALGMPGMIEASMTDSPEIRWTLPRASTTEPGFSRGPIRKDIYADINPTGRGVAGRVCPERSPFYDLRKPRKAANRSELIRQLSERQVQRYCVAEP